MLGWEELRRSSQNKEKQHGYDQEHNLPPPPVCEYPREEDAKVTRPSEHAVGPAPFLPPALP